MGSVYASAEVQLTHPRTRTAFLAFSIVLTVLVAAPVGRAAAFGGNCASASIGEVPLSDSSSLYAAGNAMPAAHAAAAPAVTPIGGVTGVVSLGMSNGRQEWTAFMNRVAARSDLGPAVRFANAAQGGQTMASWANPSNGAWDDAVREINAAGIRTDQVQVVWMKMGSQLEDLGSGSLDERIALERGWLNDVLDNAVAEFPNLRQVYLSSRIYAGYGTSPNHSETQTGYDNGYSVQAVVADAIAGVTPVWAAWGPYLWADGLTPRADGLTWDCVDFENDGIHPSGSGEDKVADLLMSFFSSEPVTCAWLLADPGTCGMATRHELHGCPHDEHLL